MTKFAFLAVLYAIALGFIYLGTQTAPSVGWPVTDSEVTGSAAIVFGVIVKTIAHGILAFAKN